MKNNDYRLGLVSVSFRKHTPEEIIIAAKKVGLSCIEWGSDVHALCRDFESLAKISSLQKIHGISCSSYGTYFRLGETPIEELSDYINAAKILGTDILRLWCGKKSGGDMTEQEKALLIESCIAAAKIAEENCVTLCMECHKKTFTERVEDVEYLMKKVNSPNFRMYWQPFQWLSADESLKIAKTVSPYAKHIHVFNWSQDLRFPLGEAIEDWRRYISVFPTPRTLLLEFMPDDEIASLCAEVDALRRIIGEK